MSVLSTDADLGDSYQKAPEKRNPGGTSQEK